MEPFASLVQISIVRSATVAWLVCGGHVFIVLVYLVAFPLSEYLVAVLVGVFISLRIQYLSQSDLFKHIERCSCFLMTDDLCSLTRVRYSLRV